MGSVGRVLGAVVSKAPVALATKIAGRGGAKSVKSTSGRTSVWSTIATKVVSYGWAVFVFALGFILWLLRLLLSRIFPSILQSFVEDWEENRVEDYNERRERLLADIRSRKGCKPFNVIINSVLVFVFSTAEFVVQFVSVTLYAFIILWGKYICHWITIIFILLVISGSMTVLQTHLPGATSVYQETAVAGLETVNAASSVGNAALSANEIITPLNNFMMYSTVSIMIQIEEGATIALGLSDPETPNVQTQQTSVDTANSRLLMEEGAGGRRVLAEADDRSAGEKFVETIINIFIVIGTFFLQILLIMVNVFFLVIFPALNTFMGILIFLIRRIGCVFAGKFCGFLEILDAIINLIWTPLALVFGRLPIACGANQLLADNVQCDCAGYFWDFGWPGIYRNLEPCGVASNRYSFANFTEYEEDTPGRRLLTVSCSKNEDGDWVEEVGQNSISKTSDLMQACPTARRAFHPYTHAQDMHRFDTHDCITHCVMGVAMLSCDDDTNHTVSMMGTCEGEAGGIDDAEAKRRLAFLGVDMSKLTGPPEPRGSRRMQEEGGNARTQAERVASLRARIPLMFSVEGMGECDLRVWPPQSVYDLMDNIHCVLGRELKQNSNWAPWTSQVSRQLTEAANHAAHVMRKHKHAQGVKNVQDLYEPGDHVSVRHIAQWESRERMRLSARKRGVHSSASRMGRRLQLVLPDDEATYAPSTSPTAYDDPNTDPVNPEDPVPCLGRFLCPDQVTCAVEEKYCSKPKDLSPIVLYSHYVQKFSSGVKSFDAYAEISKAKKCYKDRTRSPYDASYVFKSRQAKLDDQVTQFCLGEFSPTDYKFAEVQYSPNADIQTFCTGTANFTGCKCMDFWDTRGGSVQYSGVSSDFLYIFGNGIKWFLSVAWLILNAVAGFVDSLLESAGLPNFSDASRSAYGLTDAEFAKCVFLHTGDAASMVLFLILTWGFLKSAFYVADWFMRVWFDNVFGAWAWARDPFSAVSRLNYVYTHPFERMKKNFEWQVAAAEASAPLVGMDSKSLRTSSATPPDIVVPFRASEYRSALRFRRWVIKEKGFYERSVHFQLTKDGKGVGNRATLKEVKRAARRTNSEEVYAVAINFKLWI